MTLILTVGDIFMISFIFVVIGVYFWEFVKNKFISAKKKLTNKQ